VRDHTTPGEKWTETKMNEYRDKVVKEMKKIQERENGTSTKEGMQNPYIPFDHSRRCHPIDAAQPNECWQCSDKIVGGAAW
jgi:hypothetical protein